MPDHVPEESGCVPLLATTALELLGLCILPEA